MMGGVESVSRRWEELKWMKSVISRGVGCKVLRENIFFRGRCFKTLFGPNMHLGSKDRKDPSFHQMVDKILDTCSISVLHFYNSNIWKTCLVSGVLGPSSPNDQRPTPFLHKICGLKQSFYFQSPFVSICQMFPH